jgi:twitching motility protein PilT
MHEAETMEMVLEAAETGHLVLSSLNTVDAAKTIPRIVASFPSGDHAAVRGRLAKTLRYVISQRLIPRSDGRGRVAAFEVLRITPHMAAAIESDDQLDHALLEFMKEGEREGMQYFDAEIAKLVRAGLVTTDEATTYASSPEHLAELLTR